LIVAESTLDCGCGTQPRAIRLSCEQCTAMVRERPPATSPQGYIFAPNLGGPTYGPDNRQVSAKPWSELCGSFTAVRSSAPLADFLDRLFVSPGMRKRPQLGEVLLIPHLLLFSLLAPIDRRTAKTRTKPWKGPAPNSPETQLLREDEPLQRSGCAGRRRPERGSRRTCLLFNSPRSFYLCRQDRIADLFDPLWDWARQHQLSRLWRWREPGGSWRKAKPTSELGSSLP